MKPAEKVLYFLLCTSQKIINLLNIKALHFYVVHLSFIVMTYKLHIFAIGKQNTNRLILKIKIK